MQKIELSYALARETNVRHVGSAGSAIRNPLLDLLHAVSESGSISAAAKSLGLSYRHVWGELRRWEATLERSLIVWEKGQPARLSAFGEKLLWAERQAQARLAPQIEALHADLERAFAVAFDDTAQVLTFYASHDDALSALREHATAQGLHLDIRFTGSVDAIGALNEGRCTMAGFHTPPSPDAGTLVQRTYQPLLKPGQHKLIGFARRSQGLVVAPRNPLGLIRLAALERTNARFVNRELGTGTRLLTEELLAQARLQASRINGWERCESSHTGVAQAVASGVADAGMAIEAAARARGLDFVPLINEDYYLVCLKSALEFPATQALLQVLRSDGWQARLSQLAGYQPARSGQVLSLSRQLPWWRYSRAKRTAGLETALSNRKTR